MNDNKNLYEFPRISDFGVNWQVPELAKREYESKAIALPPEVWNTINEERGRAKG